ADLYRCLQVVFEKLREGSPELALPALGSFLFSDEATPDLDAVDIANRDLLEAIRKLACTIEGNALRPIDYRNLGSEELGSVYESLLEMHPQVNADAATFKLEVAAGNERKTTGSYYTHSSLVQCLLDSALDPVLDEAVKKPDPERALLDLKICDPASGSGHFLIAASHRIAKRLAAVRTGEDEPSPDATRSALRDVIGRCIYGVDINPMAVELCKISLWMEAMEPGKSLGFLDHHIKCGNSLLGTTPALMADGIPNDAFKPIEGDDKIVCKDLKAQNKRERGGQMALGEMLDRRTTADLSTSFEQLANEDDASVEARARKAAHYRALVQSPEYANAWLLADAWCAAFVLPKMSLDDLAVTHRRFRTWEADPERVRQEDRQTIRGVADEYQLFHWYLAFPEVFWMPDAGEQPENKQCGWPGGFDCVLGNPPWERIKLQEKEFFASRSPEISEAPNAAARRRLIAQLEEGDPSLWNAFKVAKRKTECESTLVRDSGKYPLCGRGDVNTYTIFAELKRDLISERGRVGCIVPSGIATDDTTKYFFQDLMEKESLISLYDFENRDAIFPGVHRSYKFCLLTLTGAARPARTGADFAFFALGVDDLRESSHHFSLTAKDIELLNPNTRNCPIFRSQADAELTKAIYRRVPVLWREETENQPEVNPWGLSFKTMFHMANDSHHFRTAEELRAEGYTLEGNVFVSRFDRYLPLYEAKMLHQFDHRWATYENAERARDVTVEE
ncbi:MAG: N-6 DNA methylase, partial [Lentisphaeria bacterium]|nr:N-6 DNA methylase [Lentisphaeria bacterium]